MTRFGVLLGIGGTVLVAFILLTIYVLDPLGFISVPLSQLYSAPDSRPMVGLAAGWAVLALAVVWAAAVVEGRLARRWSGQSALLRTFGALALLGGVSASSFVPGLPIGLGFIVDAENGGFFTGDGAGLMSGVWAVGFAAAVAGVVGFLVTQARRRATPGVAPVSSPARSTATPATRTSSTPAARVRPEP